MKEMDDKTTFNNAANKGKSAKKKQRNYTNKEVVEKTDAYASVAKTPEQKREMQEIKDRYFKRSLKKQSDRGIRNRNLQMGIRAGIHPRDVVDRIERQDQEIDQNDRNKTMKAARNYYRKNYSLSKDFKDAKTRTKIKDKGMDKG